MTPEEKNTSRVDRNPSLRGLLYLRGWVMLAAIIAVSGLIDLLTSYQLIAFHGFSETNPWANGLIEFLGILGGLVAAYLIIYFGMLVLVVAVWHRVGRIYAWALALSFLAFFTLPIIVRQIGWLL